MKKTNTIQLINKEYSEKEMDSPIREIYIGEYLGSDQLFFDAVNTIEQISVEILSKKLGRKIHPSEVTPRLLINCKKKLI